MGAGYKINRNSHPSSTHLPLFVVNAVQRTLLLCCLSSPPHQALCGCTVSVPTLDGRTLTVTTRDIVRPGTKRRFTGEGLPLAKSPGRRGDLVVDFEVTFPERLSASARETISQVLPPS